MTPSSPKSLTERLAEMRGALGKTSAAQAPPPASRPLGAGASTAEITDWVAAEVRLKSGLTVTGPVREKLRQVIAGIPSQDLYAWALRLRAPGAEISAWPPLLEMLTIHETYFLRDPGQLEFLRGTALVEAVRRQSGAPHPSLRLWSAACSTGEEAFSLAFLVLETLTELGEMHATELTPRRPWRIEVLGTDLSQQAIRTAAEGRYRQFGIGAFRNLPPRYWRYFIPGDGGDGSTPDKMRGGKIWHVRPEVRRLVRFQPFNLMSALPPLRDLDIALCRNVLIYFDDAGKRHVFRLIHQALKPGGVAAFGPTDIPGEPALFEAVWGKSAVIYRKR